MPVIFSSQARTACQKPLSVISSAIRYIKKHPALLTLSFVSAIPGSLYSLTLLSGEEPQDISSSWWSDLSPIIRFLSIANMAISIHIFMLTNLKYLPLALKKLKYHLKHFSDSYKSVLINMTSLFLGLAVGLIYGDQAFNAFLWSPLFFSIISGMTNFLSYSSRRYNGIMDLIHLIENRYDADYHFQQQCVSSLDCLLPQYHEWFNKAYKDLTLNEENVMCCLLGVYTKASSVSPESIFSEISSNDKTKALLEIISKVAIGTFCALAVVLTGIENSYDGIKLLSNNATQSIPRSCKIIIGTVPALANAIFYFISGMDFLISLKHINQYARENYFKFFKAIAMVILNVLAATGYFVVAKSAGDSEKNILQLQDTPLNDIIPIVYALAVFITGINNTDIIYHNKHKAVSNHKEIVSWGKHHNLSKENVSTLRRHSFFSCSSLPPEHTLVSANDPAVTVLNMA